jgi:hypothetical protein
MLLVNHAETELSALFAALACNSGMDVLCVLVY